MLVVMIYFTFFITSHFFRKLSHVFDCTMTDVRREVDMLEINKHTNED